MEPFKRKTGGADVATNARNVYVLKRLAQVNAQGDKKGRLNNSVEGARIDREEGPNNKASMDYGDLCC
jgi:hypothetical protein